jgi:hypothetical protein
MNVDLGTSRSSSLAHRLAAQATQVRWAPLPSALVARPSVRVRIGGMSVLLQGGWELAADRSSGGVETVYALDPAGDLHLIARRDDGEPAELLDVPIHVLDALRAHYFPGREL